jgi:hypothetical protein
MTVAADLSKGKRRKSMAKKRKSSASRLAWLPIVIGIAVTPMTIRAASVMALSGPGALTAFYPWVQIVRNPLLSVPGEIADPVGQWLMYLQFPLYGLLMTRTWYAKRFLFALSVVFFLHAGGIFLAYMLAFMQNPYLKF